MIGCRVEEMGIYLKCMNCVVCELYFNKAVKKSLMKSCQQCIVANWKAVPRAQDCLNIKKTGCNEFNSKSKSKSKAKSIYESVKETKKTKEISHHSPLEVARAPVISVEN